MSVNSSSSLALTGSYLTTPAVIKQYFFSFFTVEYFTAEEIKDAAKELINISGINTECRNLCRPYLSKLQQLAPLVIKYSAYNMYYDRGAESNPHLLDAVLSGSTFRGAVHTVMEYTAEVEEDIKTIVTLTPQSLRCSRGRFRLVEGVTPLLAACLNEKVPIPIIEFLLEKGADQNAKVMCNIEPPSILSVVATTAHYGELSKERADAIFGVFMKYKPA